MFVLAMGALAAFALTFGSAEEPSTTCGDFDSRALIRALPVVITLPSFVTDRREDEVQSCIGIVYGLKKGRRYKSSLHPLKPQAVVHSEDVSAQDLKKVVKAFRNWHFQKKKYAASKEPIYYTVIEF